MTSLGRMRRPRGFGMGAMTKHRNHAKVNYRGRGRKSFATVKRTIIRGRPAYGIGKRRFVYTAKNNSSRNTAFRRAHKYAGLKKNKKYLLSRQAKARPSFKLPDKARRIGVR